MWKHIAFALLVYIFCGLQTLGFQSRYLVWSIPQAVVVLSIWAAFVFSGSGAIVWAAVVGLTADILGSSEPGATMLVTTSASYFTLFVFRSFENRSITKVLVLALSMAVIIHGIEFGMAAARSLESNSSSNQLFDFCRHLWSSCLLALAGLTVARFTTGSFSLVTRSRSENPARRWTMLVD